MQYPVIVEQNNGVWRAVIPTLADLSAEGASFDEAVNNAQQAAEEYLSKVVITTIEVETPKSVSTRSPQTWIETAGMFKGDEEAMWRHIDELDAARRREREEIEQEYDRLEANENRQ